MSRPSFDLRAIDRAKAQARGDLMRALAGMPADTPEAAPEAPKAVGFDGGARKTPDPPPMSHGEWLSAVIASRSADAGRWFGA